MYDISKMTKIERIIYQNLSQRIIQSEMSVDSVFSQILKQLKSEQSLAVEHNGLVCLFHRVTNYVASFDIYSENNKFNMIISGIEITKWLFDHSPIRFVYGYSSNKKMVRAIRRGGWKNMGVMPESFWDGEKWIDNHMFGVSRKEFFDFLEKRNKINNL